MPISTAIRSASQSALNRFGLSATLHDFKSYFESISGVDFSEQATE